MESVVNVEDNKVKIRIVNNTCARQRFNKHALLCQISDCEITATINSEEDFKNFILNNSEIEHVNSIGSESGNKSKAWRPSKVLKIENDSLTSDQLQKLKQLVDQYWGIFSRNDEYIGTVHDRYGTHDIVLLNNKPIKQLPYPKPHAETQVVNENIDKMLKMSIIEPTTSNWTSPIVLVKKADGSERFCVDYRKVNEVTAKDCFPMPKIEAKLNKLHGCRIVIFVAQLHQWLLAGQDDRKSKTNHHVCVRERYIRLQSHAFWSVQCRCYFSASH